MRLGRIAWIPDVLDPGIWGHSLYSPVTSSGAIPMKSTK